VAGLAAAFGRQKVDSCNVSLKGLRYTFIARGDAWGKG
jgi:hypothetical protein